MDEMIRKANPFNANRLIIKLFNPLVPKTASRRVRLKTPLF